MRYRVIAEFVDLDADRRRYPGEELEIALERGKVLVDKGVAELIITGDDMKEEDASDGKSKKAAAKK